MKKILIGMVVLLILCLCACGGKQPANQGKSNDAKSTAVKKAPSQSDIIDALTSAGYLDGESYQQEYGVSAFEDDNLTDRLPAILKKKKKTALLFEDSFYLIDEMFEIQPQRGYYFAAVTVDSIIKDEPAEIFIYCKFSSKDDANSECKRLQELIKEAGPSDYEYWGSTIDTIWVSSVEETLVFYIGNAKSAATKALKKLGY